MGDIWEYIVKSRQKNIELENSVSSMFLNAEKDFFSEKPGYGDFETLGEAVCDYITTGKNESALKKTVNELIKKYNKDSNKEENGVSEQVKEVLPDKKPEKKFTVDVFDLKKETEGKKTSFNVEGSGVLPEFEDAPPVKNQKNTTEKPVLDTKKGGLKG